MEEAIQKAEHIGAFSTREEKIAIWHLAQQYITEGGLAIEVGTWTGGSAVIIGEVCRQKGARLICIDAFSADIHGAGSGVQPEIFRSVLINCYGLPIDYMAGDSRNFLHYLKPGIADFIFIDGDHRMPTVQVDIEGYWEALKPGGCYLMHDYGNPCDVKKVVDRFFTAEQLHQIDSSVYVIKGEVTRETNRPIVSSVSSAIAAMSIEKALAEGKRIEIPSLGIVSNEDRKDE